MKQMLDEMPRVAGVLTKPELAQEDDDFSLRALIRRSITERLKEMKSNANAMQVSEWLDKGRLMLWFDNGTNVVNNQITCYFTPEYQYSLAEDKPATKPAIMLYDEKSNGLEMGRPAPQKRPDAQGGVVLPTPGHHCRSVDSGHTRLR